MDRISTLECDQRTKNMKRRLCFFCISCGLLVNFIVESFIHNYELNSLPLTVIGLVTVICTTHKSVVGKMVSSQSKMASFFWTGSC